MRCCSENFYMLTSLSLSLLIQYEIKLQCKPIICLLRKHYAVVDDDEVKLLKIDYLFMQIFINMSFECLSDDDKRQWKLSWWISESFIFSLFRWYFRKIKRIEAEKKLLLPENEHGAFLIRDSESRHNDYSLSGKPNIDRSFAEITFAYFHDSARWRYREALQNSTVGRRRLLHRSPDYFQVKFDTNLTLFPQSNFRWSFRTLQELVEHYSKDSDGLCVNLCKPCVQVNENNFFSHFKTTKTYRLSLYSNIFLSNMRQFESSRDNLFAVRQWSWNLRLNASKILQALRLHLI